MGWWGMWGVTFVGMENAIQMLNLNESEMLALCKRVMKLEPVRRDCTVERDDGIDIDAWIMMRARSWYAQLLMEGPLEWLPVEDVRDEIALTAGADGAVKAVIAPRCVRPVEWQLEGWHTSVSDFAAPGSNADKLQHNPWTRAGSVRPVAVDHGGWLMLYSVGGDAVPTLAMARCVVTPAGGRFVFHQAALPSLEPHLVP